MLSIDGRRMLSHSAPRFERKCRLISFAGFSSIRLYLICHAFVNVADAVALDFIWKHFRRKANSISTPSVDASNVGSLSIDSTQQCFIEYRRPRFAVDQYGCLFIPLRAKTGVRFLVDQRARCPANRPTFASLPATISRLDAAETAQMKSTSVAKVRETESSDVPTRH